MKNFFPIFIAVLPLIVSFSTSDPTLSLRFFVLSLIVTFGVLHNFFSKQLISKEILLHPFIISFGIMLLCYFSSAFVNGFGAESIFVLLRLFLCYLFLILIVQHILEEGFESIINSFILFSLFVSVVYFYQLITNYSHIMEIKSEYFRNKEFDAIASTMGHKNLLSSIQFLLLPMLIHESFCGKRLFKILSIISIFFILITLVQTQTRSVIIAIVIFSISLLILNISKITKKKIYISLALLFTFLFSSFLFLKSTNRIDPLINELNKTLDFTSSSRYILYKNTLELIIQYPFFGVGPGNWSIDIWKYGIYEGASGKSFAQRPHNDFLWVFSEGGFVAGVSYILLFLILLRESYLLHKNRKDKNVILYSLLFSCFLGYGFISLVDFPMERISHNIVFFVLASIVISAKIKNDKTKIHKSILYLLIFLSLFAVYVGFIRYVSDVHTTNAIYYKEKGDWNYVLKAIDRGYSPLYYNIENTSTPLMWYRGVAYFNQKKYSLALKDFQSAYKINPFHVHVLNNLATLHQIKGDSKEAKKYYNAVFEVNPTFKESRVNLAAILYNEKKYLEALDMILNSKVDAYWKRKKSNDNYDLYLKTIFFSYINSFTQTDDNKKKVIDKIKNNFETSPKGADLMLRKAFKIRREKEIDYLEALLLIK